MSDEWAPTPDILKVYNILALEAEVSGNPARMKAGTTRLVGYAYCRNTHPDGCKTSSGVAWKIKYDGEKYKSCSVEAAQRLIGEGLKDA